MLVVSEASIFTPLLRTFCRITVNHSGSTVIGAEFHAHDGHAGKIKAEYEGTPHDLRPTEILIDIIGLGAGVYDPLQGSLAYR